MSIDDPNNQATPPDPHDPVHEARSSERTLWRSFAGNAAGDDCPSALDLAAYIDDRLPARERASLESHLARCSACHSTCRMALEETRAVIAERGEVLPLVPGEVIRAAKALVEPARRSAGRPGSPTRLRFPSIWSFARAGAAAAASIAICIAGYRAGAASSMSSSGGIDLSAEMSFGLLDPVQDGTEDDELFAIAFEREGENR